MSSLSETKLSEFSTELLGAGLSLALNGSRKGKFVYECFICNRLHSGAMYCEFCIADELYPRRHTMEFMRLDLCIQAAVCLIAKPKSDSTATGAQARGANKLSNSEKTYSPSMLINENLIDPERLFPIRLGGTQTGRLPDIVNTRNFFEQVMLKPYIGDDNDQD